MKAKVVSLSCKLRSKLFPFTQNDFLESRICQIKAIHKYMSTGPGDAKHTEHVGAASAATRPRAWKSTDDAASAASAAYAASAASAVTQPSGDPHLGATFSVSLEIPSMISYILNILVFIAWLMLRNAKNATQVVFYLLGQLTMIAIIAVAAILYAGNLENSPALSQCTILLLIVSPL